MIKVTVWNEFVHEKEMDDVKALYPNGIHEYIAGFLGTNEDMKVRTAWLEQPENGLPQEIIDDTDVLLWWGHCAHQKVSDEVAQRVKEAVLKGMGLIVLHSAHDSKPFKLLMGTSCSLNWREGCREHLWCVNPSHPIAEGIPLEISLDAEEMYGEFFDIPEPDELVFIGWFNGGEVFRSGCAYKRGFGKVFYFQPGHETNPTYHHPDIQKIITNAVRWAYCPGKREDLSCVHAKPLEQL